MKKLGMVLGVAAVATLAGCKDPDYKRDNSGSQNEVKSVPVQKAAPVAVETKPTEKKCTCAPGTRHTSPCACGASDCLCVVETKPISPAPVAPVAVQPAPETTVYIVQSGDYLAKISKKFNIRIDVIRKLNNLKGDIIRVGQKLKLPGKIDVGEQKAPTVKKTSAAPAAKKTYAPYAGATKDYVVKSGDTLGGIAYGNGINIRQLKALNGLSSDALKVGQKLKVPATAASKAPTTATVAEAKKPEVKPAAPVEAPTADAAEKATETEKAPTVEADAVEDTVDAVDAAEQMPVATVSYVVREGDDFSTISMNYGVSPAEIRELNGMGETDQLEVGKTIKLPASVQQ